MVGRSVSSPAKALAWEDWQSLAGDEYFANTLYTDKMRADFRISAVAAGNVLFVTGESWSESN